MMLPPPSNWNAKSVMIQRSSNVSYRTTGSPKLWLSQLFPKLPWLMNVSKVNAVMSAPVLLLKMPMDVLIAWT